MTPMRGARIAVSFRVKRLGFLLWKSVAPLVFVLLLSLPCVRASAGPLDGVVEFNIQATTLDKALLAFGTQAHVQIMFAWNSKTGRIRTKELKGSYTARSALATLLTGTSLVFHERGGTVTVEPGRQSAAVSAASPSAASDPVGQDSGKTKSQEPGGRSPVKASKRGPGRSGAEAPLQEIVVTGTHIRGAPPQSEPIIEITRDEIQDAGYPTLQDFMKSIPQNFGGLGSDTAQTPEDGDTANFGFGTGVDLRGLGFDSTLVLVNGHRLAPSGVFGAFTDISVIPVSAIQKIDVMTAGASAIYGSDAVGGVVNIVLRAHQNGAETAVSYGGVTRGALRDYRAAQSFGTEWATGSGFISYEYHDETPLPASDRPYSMSGGDSSNLLPEWRQHALFGTLDQSVGDDLMLTGEAFYADRHDNTLMFAAPDSSDTREYFGTFGADWRIAGTWHATVMASYGGSSTTAESLGSTDGANARTFGLDATSDGTLAHLPTGNVRVALGAQFRRDRLTQSFGGYSAFIPAIDTARNVESVFAEADIPLVAPKGPAASPTEPLSLHVAARWERYSDFGSSVNPEAGVAWNPSSSVRVRSTWDSSYSAPKLFELYGPVYAYLLNSPDPLSPSGLSAALVLGGANANLHAEKSSQWTLGVDLSPALLSGFVWSTTYYQIHYRDRIASPPFPSLFGVLDAGRALAPFIERGPTQAEVASVAGPPRLFFNETTFPGYGPPQTLADVAAVVTGTLQNVATTDTNGVDISLRYAREGGGYRYTGALASNYTFALKEVPLRGIPAVSQANTLYQPLKFRARATGGVSRGPLGASVSLNYYTHYTDNSVPNEPISIASWTTVDYQLRYDSSWAAADPGKGRGVEVDLNCANCFDRDPPYVHTPFDALQRGYDPTNANPLGRFVSLSATVRW